MPMVAIGVDGSSGSSGGSVAAASVLILRSSCLPSASDVAAAPSPPEAAALHRRRDDDAAAGGGDDSAAARGDDDASAVTALLDLPILCDVTVLPEVPPRTSTQIEDDHPSDDDDDAAAARHQARLTEARFHHLPRQTLGPCGSDSLVHVPSLPDPADIGEGGGRGYLLTLTACETAPVALVVDPSDRSAVGDGAAAATLPVRPIPSTFAFGFVIEGEGETQYVAGIDVAFDLRPASQRLKDLSLRARSEVEETLLRRDVEEGGWLPLFLFGGGWFPLGWSWWTSQIGRSGGKLETEARRRKMVPPHGATPLSPRGKGHLSYQRERNSGSVHSKYVQHHRGTNHRAAPSPANDIDAGDIDPSLLLVRSVLEEETARLDVILTGMACLGSLLVAVYLFAAYRILVVGGEIKRSGHRRRSSRNDGNTRRADEVVVRSVERAAAQPESREKEEEKDSGETAVMTPPTILRHRRLGMSVAAVAPSSATYGTNADAQDGAGDAATERASPGIEHVSTSPVVTVPFTEFLNGNPSSSNSTGGNNGRNNDDDEDEDEDDRNDDDGQASVATRCWYDHFLSPPPTSKVRRRRATTNSKHIHPPPLAPACAGAQQRCGSEDAHPARAWAEAEDDGKDFAISIEDNPEATAIAPTSPHRGKAQSDSGQAKVVGVEDADKRKYHKKAGGVEEDELPEPTDYAADTRSSAVDAAQPPASENEAANSADAAGPPLESVTLMHQPQSSTTDSDECSFSRSSSPLRIESPKTGHQVVCSKGFFTSVDSTPSSVGLAESSSSSATTNTPGEASLMPTSTPQKPKRSVSTLKIPPCFASPNTVTPASMGGLRPLSPCSKYAQEWEEKKRLRRSGRGKGGLLISPAHSLRPARKGKRGLANDGQNASQALDNCESGYSAVATITPAGTVGGNEDITQLTYGKKSGAVFDNPEISGKIQKFASLFETNPGHHRCLKIAEEIESSSGKGTKRNLDIEFACHSSMHSDAAGMVVDREAASKAAGQRSFPWDTQEAKHQYMSTKENEACTVALNVEVTSDNLQKRKNAVVESAMSSLEEIKSDNTMNEVGLSFIPNEVKVCDSTRMQFDENSEKKPDHHLTAQKNEKNRERSNDANADSSERPGEDKNAPPVSMVTTTTSGGDTPTCEKRSDDAIFTAEVLTDIQTDGSGVLDNSFLHDYWEE